MQSKEWPGVTCLDINIFNNTLPSGNFYWIQPGVSKPFRVFCDMNNGGYTLIESFSYMNNTPQSGPFRDFLSNNPVNSDLPIDLSFYRLDLTRMLELQALTSRWRATCNADVDITQIMNKDFIIARQAVRDFMAPYVLFSLLTY
jgi:hypothetical protein